MAATYAADMTDNAIALERRASSLRSQADDLTTLEAMTYRRRAAELELEAWALRVRSGADVALAA